MQLKQFFGYEESEPENIDEILNIHQVNVFLQTGILNV